jgi:hypothetical protein
MRFALQSIIESTKKQTTASVRPRWSPIRADTLERGQPSIQGLSLKSRTFELHASMHFAVATQDMNVKSSFAQAPTVRVALCL